MEQYYYNFGTGQSYTAAEMRSKFGVDPETTNIEVLNNQGFYPEQASTPDFDVALYDPTYVWVTTSLVSGGEGAIKSYTAVPRPLPEAKDNASAEVKTESNAAAENLITSSGVNVDIWTGAASQSVVDRPPVYTTLLNEMTTIGDTLASNLAAIAAATTVDEIDSIVHQPSGTFVSGRGGAGPNDMHPSYFSVLTNLPPGIGEPELEIYIPGTNTVIPYNPSLPAPSKFDSAGNCYNTGDYRTTIRVAATGQVLSTVTPAFGPIVPINWTYNPTIPSLGGGSSSSRA